MAARGVFEFISVLTLIVNIIRICFCHH